MRATALTLILPVAGHSTAFQQEPHGSTPTEVDRLAEALVKATPEERDTLLTNLLTGSRGVQRERPAGRATIRDS
jgi:hypothetical protein